MAINITELTDLAKSRLEEAEMLFSQKKYDTAYYLCGYAIEIAIKVRICKTLKWSHFPPEKECKKVFQQCVKTHDLNNLLCLSGITPDEIDTLNLRNEWDTVAKWDPENRYQKIGSVVELDVQELIDAVKKLLAVFLS